MTVITAPKSCGPNRLDKRIASGLIWFFVLQTVVRLIGMLPPFQRTSWQALLVHALDMALLAGVAILLLRLVRGRKVLQGGLALLLSAAVLALLAFDAASVLAIWFKQRVAPLSTVAIFYCNAETIRACAPAFPGIALGLAAFWLALAGLIFKAADALSGRFSGLLGSKLRYLLYAFVVGWSTVWLLAFAQITVREPLVRFLGKARLGPQPRALMNKPRPAYQIAPSPAAKPRLLVLIAIDSLRADSVELAPGKSSRTPFLQDLAASGRLTDFGPAVAICPTSYCGITGLLSSSDWATLQRGPPLMLPDVLAANGYRSHFLLSGPHKRVLNLAKLYGPNVSTLLDDSSPDSSGLIDDREQVRRLRELPLADPARSFVFIHLMSAHVGGLRFDQADNASSRWGHLTETARYTGSYADYYDRGVRQADLILRQLFAVLAERGLLEQATVVITADHGERLTGETGHGGAVDLETALIPMLVYNGGGQTAGVPSGGVASQVDAAPTLLAAAGIGVPPEWAGRPFQQGITRRAAPSDNTHQAALVGRVGGRWVMLRCDLKSGAISVLPRAQALPQPSAVLALEWSADAASRSDSAACR